MPNERKRLAVNKAGLEIIKQCEGWSAVPYLCPGDVWTIGYGTTRDDEGRAITQDHPKIGKIKGKKLLARDIRSTERAVARLINVNLTENEFSALVSFTYNVGSGALQRSTLRSKLNRSEYVGAANEFKRWRRSGGRVLPGLVRRRAVEAELFLS